MSGGQARLQFGWGVAYFCHQSYRVVLYLMCGDFTKLYDMGQVANYNLGNFTAVPCDSTGYVAENAESPGLVSAMFIRSDVGWEPSSLDNLHVAEALQPRHQILLAHHQLGANLVKTMGAVEILFQCPVDSPPPFLPTLFSSISAVDPR